LSDRADPIFLIGIMPRSGTNYVYNLLRQHGDVDCVTNADMPEDFLLFHSDLLLRYADVVAAWWVQYWRPGRGARATKARRHESRSAIAAALGRGLVGVLEGPDTRGRRVATKTPVVRSMDNVFALFPEAQVVVLVRDGRDQVASAVRSYGWNIDFAMHRWAEAARTVTAFDDAHAQDDPPRHMILRYEDVIDDPETSLTRMFSFLGLRTDGYDFTVHERLPVYGSSEHLGVDEGLAAGYRRVERTAEFDPRRRWADWPAERLERFNHIAGREMVRLGYELEGAHPQASAVHRIRDVPWHLRTGAMHGLSKVERLVAGAQLFRKRALEFPLEQ
jgi:protein-tyrosine sulfotransferase